MAPGSAASWPANTRRRRGSLRWCSKSKATLGGSGITPLNPPNSKMLGLVSSSPISHGLLPSKTSTPPTSNSSTISTHMLTVSTSYRSSNSAPKSSPSITWGNPTTRRRSCGAELEKLLDPRENGCSKSSTQNTTSLRYILVLSFCFYKNYSMYSWKPNLLSLNIIHHHHMCEFEFGRNTKLSL